MISRRDCGQGYEIAIREPEKTNLMGGHKKLVHDASTFDASLCSWGQPVGSTSLSPEPLHVESKKHPGILTVKSVSEDGLKQSQTQAPTMMTGGHLTPFHAVVSEWLPRGRNCHYACLLHLRTAHLQPLYTENHLNRHQPWQPP